MRLINYIKLTLFFLIFFITKTQAASNSINYRIGMYDLHLQELKEFTKNELCPSITNTNLNNHHVLADYLVFCNALRVANLNVTFDFVGYPIFQRALSDIYKGNIDAAAFTFWNENIDKNLALISPDIILNGQYAKGIYTNIKSTAVLDIKQVSELSQFPAITNLNWQKDVKHLLCLKAQIHHADSLEDIMRLTAFQRNSFMLQIFTHAKDLSQTYKGNTIYPVEGYKVVFNDSLNFAVSPKTHQSKQLYKALTIGVKQLRAEGLIDNVYQEVGLLNPVVKDWKNIGCANTKL